MGPMEIRIRKFREIYIIILEGELDLYNAPRLEACFRTVHSRGAAALILDFENVTYIDSSGIGILLKLKNMSSENSLKFTISGVDGEVLNVLKLTNLLPFFSLAENYRQGIRMHVQGAESNGPQDLPG